MIAGDRLPSLETPRLVLRWLEENDLRALETIFSHPEVLRYWGGDPTPDEPTVFSTESLAALVRERFEIVKLTERNRPHSASRTGNVRALARKIVPDGGRLLDKEQVLKAYEARLP